MPTTTTGKFFLLLSIFAPLPNVYAWGASGHQAVGFVAMEFLAPKAQDFVTANLDPGETLGAAATWADEIRSQSAFAWSSPLHFVDAEDDPPTECSLSESRDCADGRCILTAIANYTSQVVDENLSALLTNEALKFIDHFIGDIGQPLHVEAFKLGGNDITAKCDGRSTNLHAVWDSGIINKRLDDDFGGSVSKWVDLLVSRIKTGIYSSEAADWIQCSSTTEPVKRSLMEDIKNHLASRATTPLECPHIWGVEANALNCEFVFTFGNFNDLCTSSYFDDAVPLIDLQIAKQGFRLAAWLNVLFDGDTNLP